ncbi:MAG TPA: 16S rRNA (uracil(1498)-N(3))-methyltransferase [Holophagaceae bacterium]|jgi:16S rRNA (uracil1498-N3)-methyltransferase|nr:16S rRNA (uracil(1498)-N(3))-methyltransferase [Holophagaceae bacterium]
MDTVSLPRIFIAHAPLATAGAVIPMGPDDARHLKALRLHPGDALELVLASGVWKAEVAQMERERALVRLVAPLTEDREPSLPLHLCIPLTAQLSLVDEMLPPLVELGATLIQPVVYARSENDAKKGASKRDRWLRLIQSAAEQSHRSLLPELRDPLPFETLLRWDAPQKWVAYELPTDESNPSIGDGALALTSGPEGGITDEEFAALQKAGWKPVSLGKSILRAVTAPAALLGAARFLRP